MKEMFNVCCFVFQLVYIYNKSCSDSLYFAIEVETGKIEKNVA